MVDHPFESKSLDDEVAIAYFWSPSCKQCKVLGKPIESFVKSKNIPLHKIDVSVELDIALKYNVLSLPTLIFFRNGREELRLTARDVSMAEVEKACGKIRKVPS